MKFAVYVDILEQIIYAKFKNDRAKDNKYTRCTEMENFYFRERFQQSVFHSCVTIQCPNCYHILSGILAITY